MQKKYILTAGTILMFIIISGCANTKETKQTTELEITAPMPEESKTNTTESKNTTDDLENMTMEERNLKYLNDAGLTTYPKALKIIVLKKEKKLELWAADNGIDILLTTYDILAASGTLGPKLKEGDKQVPEGIYRIVYLNPNSKFHLSMLLNYPNNYDKTKAEEDGRTNLGGDICIHGGAASIGCVAIGDAKIEELYKFVSESGINNVEVVIAPYDLREETLSYPIENKVEWSDELYDTIREAM